MEKQFSFGPIYIMHISAKYISTLFFLCSFACSQSSWEKKYIREINGLVYAPVSKIPYTGEVFELDEMGNIVEQVFYKQGRREGESHYAGWFSNGQKQEERNFAIGENDG